MNDVPKFVFNCTDCGKCCERDVSVYLDDIRDWMEHGIVYMVLPYLDLQGDYGSVSMRIEKKEKDGGTVCALYDTESSECTIKENKPISCRSYPLGYNGKNFIVVGGDCPGLGQGKMTSRQLNRMRETAQAEYETRHATELIVPMLQSLFIRKFSMESQRAIEELSPEEREELEKILKKR